MKQQAKQIILIQPRDCFWEQQILSFSDKLIVFPKNTALSQETKVLIVVNFCACCDDDKFIVMDILRWSGLFFCLYDMWWFSGRNLVPPVVCGSPARLKIAKL